MCRRVSCSKCGGPTYAGCGAHVEQVLGDVKPADRCRCRETKETKHDTGVAVPGPGNKQRSWLGRLLGE